MKNNLTVLLFILSFGITQAQGLSDLSLVRINDLAKLDDGVIDFDKPNTYIGKIALRYNVISDQI